MTAPLMRGLVIVRHPLATTKIRENLARIQRVAAASGLFPAADGDQAGYVKPLSVVPATSKG